MSVRVRALSTRSKYNLLEVELATLLNVTGELLASLRVPKKASKLDQGSVPKAERPRRPAASLQSL